MVSVMDVLKSLLFRKVGRLGYFLSLLIIVAWFYYAYVFFVYEGQDGCLTCHPILSFPWKEILEILITIILGGGYSCLLFCLVICEESYDLWPVLLSFVFALFYFVQTVRRCQELGKSGWKTLIPLYSPLFLLFLSGKNNEEHHSIITSLWMTLWNNKWLILTLLIICWAFYHQNSHYIYMHYRLYS